MRLIHFTDAGHGWLRVPVSLLEDYQITEKISVYSYMKVKYAYLEEDSDTLKFLDAAKKYGDEYEITSKYSYKSPIRDYSGYDSDWLHGINPNDIIHLYDGEYTYESEDSCWYFVENNHGRLCRLPKKNFLDYIDKTAYTNPQNY